MTTVVLADDHHVVRQGIRALLEAESSLSVVGEAADGLEASELVRRLHPTVLVTDLIMDKMNGIEVAKQVRQHSPTTLVVILSMYSNEAYVLEALRAGAKAYVLKQSTQEELVAAIKAVIAGRRYLSSPISERAVEEYMMKTETVELDPYETLTSREREVLNLVVHGYSNSRVAKSLYISQRTVEGHRASVMHKLGLKHHTELVHYAVLRGILPPSK